jgi:hypothetical protein
MDSFGGAAAFSFDAATKEVFVADGYRNHRVAVVDMTTGAIKRFWGAYGNKPDDADTAKYTPGGTPPKQFGCPCSARRCRTTEWSTCATRRTTEFRSSRKTDRSSRKSDRAADEGHGLGLERRVLARPAAEVHVRRDGMNMRVHISIGSRWRS